MTGTAFAILAMFRYDTVQDEIEYDMSRGILKLLKLHRLKKIFFFNLMTTISYDRAGCFHQILPAGGKPRKAEVQKQRQRWPTLRAAAVLEETVEGSLPSCTVLATVCF